jgi:4'-phosphopantetheinyl transferase
MDLSRNEVHLWYMALDLPRANVALWRTLLSSEELERAEHFRNAVDREHYIMRHASIRIILSKYTYSDCRSLRFSSNRYGKPFLRLPEAHTPIQFSFSHSHRSALLAVASDRRVGVDIEFCDTLLADRGFLAEDQVFSADELQQVRKLPPQLRAQAFYNCWTRKEAVTKALGFGLSLPPEALRVSFAPGEPAEVLRTCWDPNEVYRWRLYSLQTDSGCIAALAVEGHDWIPRHEIFDWRAWKPFACGR